MKLGIVIYSNDSETVWNAFRLGVFALKQGDAVEVFLFGKGVECQAIDNEQFKVADTLSEFIAAGGCVLACGTCLKLRNTDNAGICEISTMQDLHRIVRECDKVLTF
ncbi:MAG: DsrE family protein [Sulfuriferula sp.]